MRPAACTPSRSSCWSAIGSSSRARRFRCSPFACTSSSAGATLSTHPLSLRPTATSPSRRRRSCRGDRSRVMLDRLPEDWVEETATGRRVKSDRRKYLPRTVTVAPDGTLGGSGAHGQLVPAPFRFCLACGVTYGSRQTSDHAKLATLGSGGRSTATTILALSAVRTLRHDQGLKPEARKLLSFTDNRQDASLQAGHFNDFVEIGLLRSALYRAVTEAGEQGIGHDELTQRVFAALDLPLALYAADPAVRFNALTETQRALRDVIGYRLYLDLRRGWRVTHPT